MKIKPSKMWFFIAAICGAFPLLADPTSLEISADKFPEPVPYELGRTQFAPGDSITIQQLRGASKEIGPGGTFVVTGTYTLTSHEEADLAFYAATRNSTPTPIDAKQIVHLKKGTGTFSLIKTMTDPGYLHLTFYSNHRGQDFGGVYFGQGRWVLRDTKAVSSAPGNKSK